MTSAQNFEELVDNMINTIYADQKAQLIIYHQEGRDWINALYQGLPIENKKTEFGLHGGLTVDQIIECMGIVVATFTLLKDIVEAYKQNRDQSKKRNQEDELEELRREWKKRLKSENVKGKVADRIIDEFSKDVQDIIRN